MCARNCILPVLHWLRRHGSGSLLDLTEQLNNHRQQKEIAVMFHVQPSQLSTFISDTYDVRYIVKEEIQQALDAMEAERINRLEQYKRDKTRILQLATSRATGTEKDRK